MTITILEALDLGDDRLQVRGTLQLDGADPTPLTAQGWVSATQTYYPPELYAPDGHRVAGAVARPMTTDEIRAYALDLLTDVAQAQAAPTARRLL